MRMQTRMLLPYQEGEAHEEEGSKEEGRQEANQEVSQETLINYDFILFR